MDLFLQQLIGGVASGSMFAILALGIVLIYRSTGTLNFAQGQMAMFSMFVAWSAMSTGMGFWPAVLLTLLSALAMGALVEWLIVRRVEGTSDLNSLIVAMGLFLIFDGLALYIWGPLPKSFGPFSFFSGGASCVGGVCIGRLNLGILVVSIVTTALLYLLFQCTRFGLALRATALNRLASRLVGIPVGRMLSTGWGLGTAVGAIAGILAAQSLGLDIRTMFFVVLFALAAAVLGGLDSPVGAVVGGLIIGVVKNLAGTYTPSSVGSIDLAVAFAVIVLVLMVRPNGIFGRPVRMRV
ncbi:MAG: branched-chain amino acid ABC transporter permease [Caldilineaceae bacterium SB0662_bin_9]|uniref:Branched-chain amino acid ABC transporter permease n=1 Tax=Caldilineaceae bacterium SB0662_bin_9 TaxID=2605258 RepID=A0A6B1DRX5_9CHLR|nr:branched-chain amino acid ABC transporter permease [Caldilineaceae bacterium SB0662_bin_9]